MNASLSTYLQNELNATLVGSVSLSPFTGKERDEETGYSYFGARYYDADLLTGWMSVDPMSDKYPSISPYAYCAWNPAKLVDLDGMIIDTNSVSVEIWNMVNPNHECYNAEFAEVFHLLAIDPSTVFIFEEWENDKIDRNSIISGSLIMIESVPNQLDIVSIGYLWGAIGYGIAPERYLFEEVYHAKQFLDGQFGFGRVSIDDDWSTMGFDLVDEENAHKWADRVSGSSNSWTDEVAKYYEKDKKLSPIPRNVTEHWQKYDGTTQVDSPDYDKNGVYKYNYRTMRKPNS